MGPHAYGPRPTRTSPDHVHAQQSGRSDSVSGRPHHRAADPSLEHPADTPGRSSPSSSTVRVNTPCSCPNTDDVTRGLTVHAVYLKRSAIGSVALSAWPRSGPNVVHAMHADERPRRPSNAPSSGPIVCRQSGGQGAAGSNPVIPAGTRRRPEAVSEKSGTASRPVPASSPGRSRTCPPYLRPDTAASSS